MFDDGAAANPNLVHDELIGRDAENETVAMPDEGQRFVAGRDSGPAQRARGRVSMELTDGSGQLLEEFLHGHDVHGLEGHRESNFVGS
jgi:hypothetical protein